MPQNSSTPPVTSICCIGAGYVGGPTMAVIADRCPDVQVTVVDINQPRIDALTAPDFSKLPVYKLGMDAVLARGRTLYISTAAEEPNAPADLGSISVNTYTQTKCLKAGLASALRWVEPHTCTVVKVARAAGLHLWTVGEG